MRVPASEVEIAAAWLLERFSAGFEERDAGEAVELAVYTGDAGEAVVRSAFPDGRAELVQPGWEDRWKEFHRPVHVGGLWIGPPWITPPPDTPSVVVDPGRAFGTGAHPTTRTCIELLARLDRGALLDAGCGSGVVAVAAVRLGFAPVLAADLDSVAVEVATATARANGVTVEAAQLDVLHDVLPAVDVVVANIELAIVESMLQCVTAQVAVTSGYLSSESPRVAGWLVVDRLELEGWAADVLAKR